MTKIQKNICFSNFFFKMWSDRKKVFLSIQWRIFPDLLNSAIFFEKNMKINIFLRRGDPSINC